MIKEHFFHLLEQHPKVSILADYLTKHKHLQVKGTIGSFRPLLAGVLSKKLQSSVLTILPNKEEAVHFYNDAKVYLSNEEILFFPASFKRVASSLRSNEDELIMRTQVLMKLANVESTSLVVTYPEALLETVPHPSTFVKSSMSISLKEQLTISTLQEWLNDKGFAHVDFVSRSGEYAIRGSIVDVFSFSTSEPIRIDFFGDEVDSIRFFDIDTQTSKRKLQKILLTRNVLQQKMNASTSFISAFWSTQNPIWAESFSLLKMEFEKLLAAGKGAFVAENLILEGLDQMITVEFASTSYFDNCKTVVFQQHRQPPFQKNFELLHDDLEDRRKADFQVVVCSENQKQTLRLEEVLASNSKSKFKK